MRIGLVNKQIRFRFIERAILKGNIVNHRRVGPMSENPETIHVSDIPAKFRSNRAIREKSSKESKFEQMETTVSPPAMLNESVFFRI